MINSVYKTCLAIANKNNFGYITPADINQYAPIVQLDIFEDLFSKYNKQINLENVRQSGTGMANLSGIIAETIELFSVTNFLTPSANNIFQLPSLTTTGDEWYNINKIVCYPTVLSTSTNTSAVTNQLVNTNGNFVSLEVSVGDIVVNQATQGIATVTDVVSATVLTLSADIFPLTATVYKIFDASTPRIAEKVSQSKITELSISLLTTPNNSFPAYSQQANLITVLPSTLSTKGMVQAQYYRLPLVPKYTYEVVNGSPVFNASASDYQDFELTGEFEPLITTKILQKIGIEIREADVYQAAQVEETKLEQQ